MSAANQLLDENPPPGIGHNQAPLSEQLAEILAPHRERQASMLEVSKTACIIDQASAAKTLDLDKLIKSLVDDLEKQREEIKRPFLEACREIDRSFGDLTHPLATARAGLRTLLTSWQRQVDEEARAERERLEREQRQAEAEAEAARRAAQEQREEGSVDVAGELAAMQAEDKARRIAQQAAAVRPEPLRSNLGQVGSRREIVFTITNIRTLLGWMLKQKGVAGQVEQAVRAIIGKYLKGVVGVAAIERGVEIPGVEARIDKVATVR